MWDFSEIGNNLSDNDILVLPMDVIAFDKHEELFQRVIDHFGEVSLFNFRYKTF